MFKNLNRFQIILSVLISLFFVVFLWGFFSRGIYALGFNASVFLFLIGGLFFSGIENKKEFFNKNFYWIAPMFFIILSFSIYENTFIKTINTVILPFLIIFFSGLSLSKIEGSKNWNILKIIENSFSIEISPQKATKEVLSNIEYSDDKRAILKKIFIGLSIFIGINIFIVGLLSQADINFYNKINNIFGSISFITILKILFFFFLLIILVSLNLFWKKEHIIKNEESSKEIDSIISGIVLAGTLFTYLLFIYTQIENIFLDRLPTNIQDVANLVKNGFWQLFFLSIINIVFFFVYYKKTVKSVQNILIAFLLASIIILVSAGNKMFLYIYSYGFSHEKFFASYTVLYFGILFILMVGFLFLKNKVDIVKITIILALWMYSFLNVIPVEKFIFETNLVVAYRIPNKEDLIPVEKLVHNGDLLFNYNLENITEDKKSYVLSQIHMLSSDIMNSVKNLEGKEIYKNDWLDWKMRINNTIHGSEIRSGVNKKEWYERNINNLFLN